MHVHLHLEQLHPSASAIITLKKIIIIKISDIKYVPRCCVCLSIRCEWMREEQRWLCGGVCEHQGLLTLRVWSGPCAGQRQTQLQRCWWRTSPVFYSHAASGPNCFSLFSCRDYRLSRQQWRLQPWLLRPSGATVPEGWCWEKIITHVRVCCSVCVCLCVSVRVCEMVSERKKKRFRG